MGKPFFGDAQMAVDQVLGAAKTYLHADALQMVVVGDPAVVRGPIDALSFGPITVYDTTGAPIA